MDRYRHPNDYAPGDLEPTITLLRAILGPLGYRERIQWMRSRLPRTMAMLELSSGSLLADSGLVARTTEYRRS